MSSSRSSNSNYNCKIIYGRKEKVVNASLLRILCNSLLERPLVANTISEAVFDEFLMYLDGKVIKITTNNVDELIELGNSYGMNNLIESCVRYVEHMKKYAGIILKNAVKHNNSEDTISYLLKLEGATFESEKVIYDCVYQYYKHLENKNSDNANNWYNDLKKYINWRKVNNEQNYEFKSPIEYIDKHRKYETLICISPHLKCNVKYNYPSNILNSIYPKDLTIIVVKEGEFKVNREAMFHICKEMSYFEESSGIVKLDYSFDVVEFLLDIYNDRENINCSNIDAFNNLCDKLHQYDLKISRKLKDFWCELSQNRIEK